MIKAVVPGSGFHHNPPGQSGFFILGVVMAKFKMKASCGYAGCDWVEDISEWFTEEMYNKYENGGMTNDEIGEILACAMDIASFEYWIEKEE